MQDEKPPDYSSLAELCGFIEAKARNFDQLQSIGRLFQTLRDSLKAAGSVQDSERAQIELDTHTFFLNEGSLSPMFQATTDKGETTEYPSISRFVGPWIEHLKQRVKETINPILVARYAHVLWLVSCKRERTHS
jgi:hypothetical protein